MLPLEVWVGGQKLRAGVNYGVTRDPVVCGQRQVWRDVACFVQAFFCPDVGVREDHHL